MVSLKGHLVLVSIVSILIITVFSVPSVNVSAQATCPSGFNGPDSSGNCCSLDGLSCRNAVEMQNQSVETMQRYCQNNSGAPECQAPRTNGEFCGATSIQTAIGCIPTDFGSFIPAFIRYSIALGGGIAFILMIMGAFQMLISGGNPDSVKKGREQFIAAASGLLFIILSTALLNIIGIHILNIPGFQ